MGPLNGANLRFHSPQLDTSLNCETMDTGLVRRLMCLFISQPKLVLVYRPLRDGRLSCPAYLVTNTNGQSSSCLFNKIGRNVQGWGWAWVT